MWRTRAVLLEWRRVAATVRQSRRRLQHTLEVVVARFRRGCWLALQEQRRLNHDQLVAIFDHWWKEAAICGLSRQAPPFRFPRARRLG